MGITVGHEVSGAASGSAAFQIGQGQARLREQERRDRIASEMRQLRLRYRQLEQQQEQFEAQMELSSDEKSEDKEQYQTGLEHDLLVRKLRHKAEMEKLEFHRETPEWQYSRVQKRQLAKLMQAKDYITRNPDGRYTAEEQENLLRQIDEMEHGIRPLERKPQPFPKGQDAGSLWVDESTGATMTRDDNGNVKVLVQPDTLKSFDNQLKLREKMADFAKNLFETRQLSDNSLTWDEAVKAAEDFYSDLMPQKQDSAGDMEVQADMILQQVMSPETYKAAKATGLSSVDIYYLAQQAAQRVAQGKTPETDDISKKEWLEKDNFNDYRQRFTRDATVDQIEKQFLNDPYIDTNNSVLADPEHKVTTPYATWDELTDTQRAKAYKKYLSKNKPPLRIRAGLKVSRVISPGDYKNYKKELEKHHAKLLTEEQFAEKAKADNEFLWQFLKQSNKKKPVKINQTEADAHRAIDLYGRPSYFRGM